ncbi:MAG: hypothetical protein JNK76_08485 [Planctomycetales bacterium]|nr:hypothetical protein [Planctomycetales bacterium]
MTTIESMEMNESLNERMRARMAETDAVIDRHTADVKRREDAARLAAQEVKNRHHELCSAAHRLERNWLEPVAKTFGKLAKATYTDTRQGNDGFVKELQWKHCFLGSFVGWRDGRAGIDVVINVESPTLLTVTVVNKSEVDGREYGYERKQFALVGEKMELENTQEATEWLQNELVESMARLKLIVSGIQ